MTIKDIRPSLKDVSRDEIYIEDIGTGEFIDIDDSKYDDYIICNYQFIDDECRPEPKHTFAVKKPYQYLVAYEGESESWAESWQQHMNEDELKEFIKEYLSADTLKTLTITSIRK